MVRNLYIDYIVFATGDRSFDASINLVIGLCSPEVQATLLSSKEDDSILKECKKVWTPKL